MQMTELEQVLDAFSRSTDRFLATMDGVSDAQYLAVPAPSRWSLADNAEHATVVVRGTERLLDTRLLLQPLAADAGARRVSDAEVKDFLGDRARAISAPAMVRPKGRWPVRDDMAAALRTATQGIVTWARASSADLRGFGAPHPLLGPLDGVQWILFLALHSNRHAEQAEEIRRELERS